MTFNNYQQYIIANKKMQSKIAKNYPDIKPMSGIYIFYRTVAYIGKSSEKDGILGRVASHCIKHEQHIDNSLHTRKLTCDGGQWRVKSLCYCDSSKVDEMERKFIAEYQAKGYELYNIESGGTDGKEDIGKRAERGGYRKGKAYAREKVIKEIALFFEKYLDVSVKKENKICNRKLQEFLDLIKETDNEHSNNER